MTEQTYSVPGITCGHCKAAIEGELAGLAGVHRVDVRLDAKEVVVEGDVEGDAVRAAIDRAGYEVAGVR